MKPNYKNWVPRGMVVSALVATGILAVLLVGTLATDFLSGTARTVTLAVTGVLLAVGVFYSAFTVKLYTSFSYDGEKQYARRIIEKVAGYVDLPENGRGLDVGCGSGALTIACAKRNPKGKMLGLDRWGKEYASFNRPLCENNAKIEGVADRVEFVRGDACKLDFPDESFDVVTSNFCYHNIPSRNRQAILLETLRVLKKGGTFVIHDEFTKQKYGDMQSFLQKLRDMGYEKAELLDTMNGRFLTHKEAASVFLVGSGLLVGKK